MRMHTHTLTTIFPPGPWLFTVTPIHWFSLLSVFTSSAHTQKSSNPDQLADDSLVRTCVDRRRAKRRVFRGELTIVVELHSATAGGSGSGVTVVESSCDLGLLTSQSFGPWSTNQQPVTNTTTPCLDTGNKHAHMRHTDTHTNRSLAHIAPTSNITTWMIDTDTHLK